MNRFKILVERKEIENQITNLLQELFSNPTKKQFLIRIRGEKR